MNNKMKQVILVRTDLKLPKGKMATQVAHAAVDASLKSPKHKVGEWMVSGAKKVVLKVNDKEELFEYKKQAEQAGLKTALIKDAGRTVLKPGTITCLSIGPDDEDKIDKITGKLKMV